MAQKGVVTAKDVGNGWVENHPQYSKNAQPWQTCPLCSGRGRVIAEGFTSSVFTECSVCNGQKIISTLTGKPPA